MAVESWGEGVTSSHSLYKWQQSVGSQYGKMEINEYSKMTRANRNYISKSRQCCKWILQGWWQWLDFWAHLVGPEQLHGIHSLPAEHKIKILMFEWNFQMISKETDRWPHVDERVAIIQPSVDHQDLNIFLEHIIPQSSVSINAMDWFCHLARALAVAPFKATHITPWQRPTTLTRIYDDYSLLKVFEMIIRKHIHRSILKRFFHGSYTEFHF